MGDGIIGPDGQQWEVRAEKDNSDAKVYKLRLTATSPSGQETSTHGEKYTNGWAKVWSLSGERLVGLYYIPLEHKVWEALLEQIWAADLEPDRDKRMYEAQGCIVIYGE